MLSVAKHLCAHRERSFASLRMTTYYRTWSLKFIMALAVGMRLAPAAFPAPARSIAQLRPNRALAEKCQGERQGPHRPALPPRATTCRTALAPVLHAPRHRLGWGGVPWKCSGTGLGEGWMGPCGCQAWDHPKTVGERDGYSGMGQHEERPPAPLLLSP